MSIMTVQDWNGVSKQAVRSKGGIVAFLDYSDNVVGADCVWPPPELLQKLCRSDRVSAFLPDDQTALIQRLGYYTDLQSIHSEDAMQWSFFGPLIHGTEAARVSFSNWLAEALGLSFRNQKCTMALWRRVPHPDTLSNGGPELDLLLSGDSFVVLGESKWRSGEGRWQGMAGNKTQLQLREQFLESHGAKLFTGKNLVILYVVLDVSQEPVTHLPQASIPTFCRHWADLCGWPEHPRSSEIQRYYEWKRTNVVRSFGVPAPGRQIVVSPTR